MSAVRAVIQERLEGAWLDLGNSTYGGMEALTVFDNVFVPNDRIFLNGETEFAGMLVESFCRLSQTELWRM